MTDEEKKAYRREYYQKYQKKGLKKGRKKSTSTKKSSASIVGISTSGLNDAGKMEVALIKEDLKQKMNSELSKAKTDEEKNEIRRKYQQQALDAVQKLKSDSQYVKAKAVKEKSPRSTGAKAKSNASRSTGSKASNASQITTMQKTIDTLTSTVDQLKEALAKMTEEQKSTTKDILTSIVDELKKKLGIDVSTEEVEQELQNQLKGVNNE